jgi:uncharacterized phage protein gp47/JayE
MATPQPKSYDKILGEMLNQYISETGVNDLGTGGALVSFSEAVALAVARASGDLFQVLRDQSVDRAAGDRLRTIARDEGLRELPARVATGQVTFSDTSFAKISTKVYAGGQPVNPGSLSVNASDASQFPPTGSVYIGRGTPNVEGPIAYSAATQTGGFWVITLSSPTTKFHNINETITLAQGGVRAIPVGTVVKVPGSGGNADINYTVDQPAAILDGETEAPGVPVSAQELGAKGNAAIGAIRAFSTAPFAGAAVTNPLPFKTGRDVETDEELRIRIKRARLSKGLGTSLAVKNAVIGATPADENASVVSAEIVTAGGQTTLFIDDGTGYEEKTQGVGVEFIVDSALGGETNFQLETGGRQSSVAKAYLESNLSAPFDVKDGDRLAVAVGGIVSEHIFQAQDFISAGAATAYELVASINANADLGFEAYTAEGGLKLVVAAKNEDNEDLQIADVQAGRSVAELVGFPSNKIETLRLFKNKTPLSKDGAIAIVTSLRQAEWSPSLASGDTLIVAVDGTAAIAYTITDADFIAEGTYLSVSASNSLESWANVFNAKITGVTASVIGEQIRLVSNLGASNRASVVIDASSDLVIKGVFGGQESLESQGRASDYEFSRNTAQIKLAQPLDAGDELTAGSADTAARLQAQRILGGSLTLGVAANLWFLVDDADAEIVNTGLSGDTLIAVSKPSTDIIRYTTAVAGAFSNVAVGDYVIVWSAELSAANRLEGRVTASTTTTVDIKVTASEFAAAVVESGIFYQQGFAVVRTAEVPQKFTVGAGVKTINAIAAELQAQGRGITFSAIDEEILVAESLTLDASGAVLCVTADESGQALLFPEAQTANSNDSLTAFLESGFQEGEFPLFVHSEVDAEASAVPPSTYISSVSVTDDWEALGLDPNVIVGTLQPYQGSQDVLQPRETTVSTLVVADLVSIENDDLVKRLRVGDRLYAANPLDFGHNDSVVAIFDGDATDKTFAMPFFRTAVANTTIPNNPNTFNAYDADAGPTTAFSLFFGASFDFSDFKALMQARAVLDPPAAEDAILYRSRAWGRSGEKITVGYAYPSAPNSPISHFVSASDSVDVKIVLQSAAAIPTAIDGTTEWDITVTPNIPVAGVDQVTFTWTGAGTAPALGALAGGEYVRIAQGSEISVENTGVYRVSTEIGFTPTANSFSVARAPGAVEEYDKATLSASVFQFYAALPTTAEEIVEYVNQSQLSDIVGAELVDDGGTTGAGVIGLSTAENNDFASDSVQLQDGINWIAASNLGGSPQFTFKRPLALPSATGYAFNAGTEIKLVPATIDQVRRLLNVLAVTGATTVADIDASRRERRLQIATQLLGSEGSVQVIGGAANEALASVIGSAIAIDNSFSLLTTSSGSAQNLHSDQWVLAQAANPQRKAALIRETALASAMPGVPAVGSSVFQLFNRTLDSRHFGRPRNHVRTQLRSFKVEKQGLLTCVSWDGQGSQPQFLHALNLNDTAPGTLNIYSVGSGSEFEILVLTGPMNFNEVSIGDFIDVQNMTESQNNGRFLVTGRSADGKTLRILNPLGRNQLSQSVFTITDNADVAGDDFEVDGNVFEAGLDFAVGVTAAETAQNLAAVLGTVPGVEAEAVSNTVVVTADTPSSSLTTSYTNNAGAPGASVSSATLVGSAYASGDFSCDSEVSEGDTVVIASPFNALNQGRFRVIRRFANSFYIENPSSVDELVALPANPVATAYDGTTEFDVLASDNNFRLQWTGVGTEPQFSLLRPGDEITTGTDFAAANQGTFMISRAQDGKAEISRFSLPAGSAINSGEYFLLNAAEDATEYYVWFNVDSGGGDPMVVGKTGIQVAVLSSDSATAVANAVAAAVDAVADFAAQASANTVVVENQALGPCTDAANVSVSGDFDVEILQQGQHAFLEAVNASAVAESGITISDVLEFHRPQLLFFEYEATQPGDTLSITTDALGAQNRADWLIEDVLDDDTVVVAGTMAAQEPQSLFDIEDSVFVREAQPYRGYKQIHYVCADPSNSNRALVCLKSRNQFEKINADAGAVIEAVGKLSFSTVLRKGLDSYRYHTGLIGEANRIVYGDPRDNTTYPGVSAAGAEIFIRGPLIRRVQVSISARIETGIPFSQIVEQVRTSVASLIEGNPIGESIAISDIIAVVNSIPGVRAVAIDSPLYNSLNDTIRIAQNEKSRIIDAVADITVSQIG